ncbi:MAG: endonuclease/exonuclease/phosphatase family protein, partial [Bacteroidota bacterium]
STSEIREGISSFLLSQNADIICLQECCLNGPDDAVILRNYAKLIGMKYYYFRNYRKFWDKKKIDAIIIFSRYPVVDSGFFKFPDKSLFGIYSDILLDQDTIRIYNLHLESIRFGNDDYSFYSHLTDPAEEATPLKEGTKKMFWKLKKAFITRAREVDTISLQLGTCRYPVILAGDFNDSPSSYAYHELTGNLKDAFISSGREFFGSTYAGRFPAFRIDYIFSSGRFKTLEYRKFIIGYSDHYPIAATFNLN